MNKCLLVYIATSRHYFRHFEGFLNTVGDFLPSWDKTIHVFTDQVNELILNQVGIKVTPIEHKPWPLTALLKYHYAKKAIEDWGEGTEEDLVFYADSKVEFRSAETTDKSCYYLSEGLLLQKGKLTTVPHNLAPNYPKDYQKLQWWVQDKGTNAQIDGEYEYHQSGFFGGEVPIVRELCEQLVRWTENDLANHRIPSVDDESYLNRWIFENPSKVYTLPQGVWGCEYDEECCWKQAGINLRDHSDAEYYKYLVKQGKI